MAVFSVYLLGSSIGGSRYYFRSTAKIGPMRSLLFDFGGTLDWPLHWLDRFVNHYQACGVSIARADLDPAFDAATQAAYRQSANLQNYGLCDLIRHLVRLQLDFLSKSEHRWDPPVSAEPHKVVERISDSFVQESQLGLSRSRKLLNSLAQHFTIGIVSNFYGNLSFVLVEAGFSHSIKAVTDSGCLGIYKPDLRIYRAALAMLAAEASDTIMVGDSLAKDCFPARQLGMKAVWLRHSRVPDETDWKESANFTISALDELPELLCRIS